jgi:hypothetical protein
MIFSHIGQISTSNCVKDNNSLDPTFHNVIKLHSNYFVIVVIEGPPVAEITFQSSITTRGATDHKAHGSDHVTVFESRVGSFSD